MKRILYILFGLAPVLSFSQEVTLVQVSGFIMVNDSTPVVYASLYNPKNKMLTVTNEYGYFTVLMSSTDTLQIASVGFEKKKFWLPEGYATSTYQTKVYMKRIVYTLASTRVGLINWSQFEDAFVSLPLNNADLIQGDVNYAARNYTANKTTAGFTFKGPFTALYNKFSKKARELQKLEELLAEDDIKAAANKKLTVDLVMQVTDLTEDDIEEFLNFCSIGNEFAARASTYDLMVTIRDCYAYYQKSKPYFDKQEEIHGTGNPGTSDTTNNVEVIDIGPAPGDSTNVAPR